MDEMTAFEQRFGERVRAFGRSGVRSIDSAAVAHAVVVGRRRPGATLQWGNLAVDRRVLTIAVALAVLVALIGGALVVGSRVLMPRPLNVLPAAKNGWVAFTAEGDIWLAALDRDARRVVGEDMDGIQQLCPAFSADGKRLAFGRVEGHGTEPFMNGDGTEGAVPASFRKAALVVSDVSDMGVVTDRLAVDVGNALPPPCPVWSPDGTRVAFGVNRTSPVNPTKSATGSEVWAVTLGDRGVKKLRDLLATDLEWSPDGALLAIASGTNGLVRGGALLDGMLRLYEPGSGAMRSLEGTAGAIELAWSPDGQYIAYTGVGHTGRDDGRELRLVDVETGRQRTLAGRYGVLHGIGPVWSPDGKTIAYQRGLSGEHSEVVLLTADDLGDESEQPRETVVPVTARNAADRFDPYRVTWSPDGEYLLIMGWGHPPDNPSTSEDPFLTAIPLDPAKPKVVLARGTPLDVGEGYPDTTFVPIQRWGRVPAS
jgi:Tol biopolymer transport system component